MYKKSTIAWTIAVLLFTTSSALSIGEDDKETGELQLTAEQYREITAGKIDFVPAVQLEKHEYSALQSDIDRIPIKPLPTCADLYKKFINDYGPTFQIWANKNCRTYYGIWCCPSGICYFFIEKPYRLCNWKDPIYIPKIPVWEWPQVEIEIPEKQIASN